MNQKYRRRWKLHHKIWKNAVKFFVDVEKIVDVKYVCKVL